MVYIITHICMSIYSFLSCSLLTRRWFFQGLKDDILSQVSARQSSIPGQPRMALWKAREIQAPSAFRERSTDPLAEGRKQEEKCSDLEQAQKEPALAAIWWYSDVLHLTGGLSCDSCVGESEGHSANGRGKGWDCKEEGGTLVIKGCSQRFRLLSKDSVHFMCVQDSFLH